MTLKAGADTLAEFVTQFADEMRARVGRNDLQRGIAIEIAWCASADDVLDCIRREGKLLVVLVRNIQQDLKSQYDEPDEEDGEDNKDGEAVEGTGK